MEREKEKERCDGQMPAFIWERIHAQMPTAMSKGIFTCAHPHTHTQREIDCVGGTGIQQCSLDCIIAAVSNTEHLRQRITAFPIVFS